MVCPDLTSFPSQNDHAIVMADHLYQMLNVPGNIGEFPAFLPKVAP
jgi:hypothetical protein